MSTPTTVEFTIELHAMKAAAHQAAVHMDKISKALSTEEADAMFKFAKGGVIGSVSGYAHGGYVPAPTFTWSDGPIEPQAQDPWLDVIIDKRGIRYPVPPVFPGGYPTPVIGQGSHQFDQDRKPRVGCTMELVSILSDRRVWTDHPSWTTAEPLSRLMIAVNDTIDHKHRQEMLHFVPRLIGANMITAEIEKMILEYSRLIEDLRDKSEMVQCPCGGAHLAPSGPAIVTDPDKTLQLVGEMLDHYDRMTGRPTRMLTPADLTRIGMALAA